MADAKITALTENTAPLSTDILPMVDDPAGTPLTQKVTNANLMALYANPVSDDGDTLGTTALKWGDLFLASGGVINFNSGNVTLTHSAGKTTIGGSEANGVNLTLAGGGTARAPLTFTSSTLTSTPSAGDYEYLTNIFYQTGTASNRRVDVGMYFTSNVGDFTGSSTTAAQPIFQAANDTFTAEANTTYLFDLFLSVTNGTTTCTKALVFAGTATYSKIRYNAIGQFVAANTTGTAQSSTHVDRATSTVILATGTTAWWIRARGIMRISTGGTIIPQFAYSAAPGTPVAIKSDSYMTLTPVGSDTVASVGNWA